MLVDQGRYSVSKVIALGAGVSEEPGALNVSRACGSATQAIVSDVE